MGPLIYESRALCLLSFSEQTPYQLFSTRLWGAVPLLCAGGSVLTLAGQLSVQGTTAVDFICHEMRMGLGGSFTFVLRSRLSVWWALCHLGYAKMENRSFTGPSFNIKNILSDLNKPAITLYHYSVDNFSVSFSVIPSTFQSCTWHHSVYCHIISPEGKPEVPILLFTWG